MSREDECAPLRLTASASDPSHEAVAPALPVVVVNIPESAAATAVLSPGRAPAQPPSFARYFVEYHEHAATFGRVDAVDLFVIASQCGEDAEAVKTAVNAFVASSNDIAGKLRRAKRAARIFGVVLAVLCPGLPLLACAMAVLLTFMNIFVFFYVDRSLLEGVYVALIVIFISGPLCALAVGVAYGVWRCRSVVTRETMESDLHSNAAKISAESSALQRQGILLYVTTDLPAAAQRRPVLDEAPNGSSASGMVPSPPQQQSALSPPLRLVIALPTRSTAPRVA